MIRLMLEWDEEALPGAEEMLQRIARACVEAEGVTLPVYAQVRVTDDETIRRINELAAKAKTEGLTPEELVERDQLRREYIAAVRRNLTAQLDNTYVVDEHGNKRPLRKKP